MPTSEIRNAAMELKNCSSPQIFTMMFNRFEAMYGSTNEGAYFVKNFGPYPGSRAKPENYVIGYNNLGLQQHNLFTER